MQRLPAVPGHDLPAGGAVLPGQDRLHRRSGADEGDVRRVGRPDQTPGRRAGHARGQPRRPRRHLRVELGASPRAVLRRALHRSGAAHAEHQTLPRPGRVHREPCRGRGRVRRPVAARVVPAVARAAAAGSPCRRDGRPAGGGAGGGDPGRPAVPRLRGTGRRGPAGRVPRRGREPGGRDVLHERYDGKSEGRRLLTPVHLAALDRRPDQRRDRARRDRHRDAGRADVPRERLGSGARGADGRRDRWCSRGRT